MHIITVTVETPKGSLVKYEFDKKLHAYKLSKMLPAGMYFPFSFGFLPGTKAGDGDPVDVIILAEFSSFPGCLVECRIIGAIKAMQTERDGETVRNDRLIGVPMESLQYRHIESVYALPDEMLREYEAFFKNYNEAAGKKFEVTGIADALEAWELTGGD